LASLTKLADTRGDGVTLLHFLADVVNDKDPTIIAALKEIRDVLKKVCTQYNIPQP
jgi:hypothetical protein